MFKNWLMASVAVVVVGCVVVPERAPTTPEPAPAEKPSTEPESTAQVTPAKPPPEEPTPVKPRPAKPSDTREAVTLDEVRSVMHRELLEGTPEGMTVKAGVATAHRLSELKLASDGKEAIFSVCISHPDAGAAKARVLKLLEMKGWTTREGDSGIEAEHGQLRLAAKLERGTVGAGASSADQASCKVDNQTKVSGVVTKASK